LVGLLSRIVKTQGYHVDIWWQNLDLTLSVYVLLVIALMGNRIRAKQTLTAEDHAMNVKLVMMELKIKVKMILTAEDHVLRAQLVMMVFTTRKKLMLTAEDHVLLAQLVTMGFRIKEKLPLIAEAHVPSAGKGALMNLYLQMSVQLMLLRCPDVHLTWLMGTFVWLPSEV